MSFSHRWASVRTLARRRSGPGSGEAHHGVQNSAAQRDEFVSKLYLKKEGIKYVFYQDIFRLPDMKVTVKATVESVCVVNGRLGDSALFDETFAPYLSE